MKLYAFHTGGDIADKCVNDPFDAHVGEKNYCPWFAYVITHPQGNIIFDPGADPAMITQEVAERFGSWAGALELRLDDGDDVVSKLATIGLSPTDIDIVVISHMHFDHIGALHLFRHARIIVQRAELAFARNPPRYQAGSFHAPDFEGEYDWELLDGPLDVFGDGRITLFPAPGHTPGSQILLFRGDTERVLLVGDAIYSLEKMREGRIPAFYWNPDKLLESFDFIEQLCRSEDATLLYAHDVYYKSRVRMAPDESYA